MSWFAFESHGSPPSYGNGTVGEAQALLGMFNRDRTINHYSARELSDVEIAKLQLGTKLGFVIAKELGTHSRVVLLPQSET